MVNEKMEEIMAFKNERLKLWKAYREREDYEKISKEIIDVGRDLETKERQIKGEVSKE